MRDETYHHTTNNKPTREFIYWQQQYQKQLIYLCIWKWKFVNTLRRTLHKPFYLIINKIIELYRFDGKICMNWNNMHVMYIIYRKRNATEMHFRLQLYNIINNKECNKYVYRERDTHTHAHHTRYCISYSYKFYMESLREKWVFANIVTNLLCKIRAFVLDIQYEIA